ncbi:MAG: STAS domain-containing protein [Solirubrobacterales bacterium]
MSQGNSGAIELQASQFELRSERTDGEEHIRVSGELDLSVIGEVDREVRRAEATDAPSILLDLHELDFLDASGVRLLLNASARSRANGSRLRITPPSTPQVKRVFELTGVGDILPLAA